MATLFAIKCSCAFTNHQSMKINTFQSLAIKLFSNIMPTSDVHNIIQNNRNYYHGMLWNLFSKKKKVQFHCKSMSCWHDRNEIIMTFCCYHLVYCLSFWFMIQVSFVWQVFLYGEVINKWFFCLAFIIRFVINEHAGRYVRTYTEWTWNIQFE